MKKILTIVTVLVLSLSNTLVNAQVMQGKNKIEFSDFTNIEGKLIYSNDSIDVEFIPYSNDWRIEVFNKLYYPIYICWDECVFSDIHGISSRIIFGSDLVKNIESIKPIDGIIPQTKISRRIAQQNKVSHDGFSTDIIDSKYLTKEKNGVGEIKIVIPIRFKDEVIYKQFNFKVTRE